MYQSIIDKLPPSTEAPTDTNREPPESFTDRVCNLPVCEERGVHVSVSRICAKDADPWEAGGWGAGHIPHDFCAGAPDVPLTGTPDAGVYVLVVPEVSYLDLREHVLTAQWFVLRRSLGPSRVIVQVSRWRVWYGIVPRLYPGAQCFQDLGNPQLG